MIDRTQASNLLLDAWLNLSSILWNTRVVHSMTYNEAHIMGILHNHSEEESPLTATDLIRRTRLLKSQMNKLLTTLEQSGFITRIRAQADKRMIYIRLTEAGAAAYREEHRGVEDILAKLIDRIGVERALAVSRELTDISSALDDIVPAAK
ncbi:MAG: MarR family transcriptional regulator [Clostridia bacterium]|nr:MarR family transcriptional regulator [Clostridia bacterium]MBQ4609405.1 MarR family transcriptional regulator [Clostridia bacterium]MBQ6857944.1 MarR family transcriptional regulator [Clostridia bacterium]MBQ7051253.1 MarR family transcriptional regulator [Clostridia bacterium]